MHQNYSSSFSVDQSVGEVFAAINNVRGWWSEEIDGRTYNLGDVFRYHYKDVHSCTIKISEFIPNKKVVWRVLDNYFNFIQDKSEWVNTEITFELAEKDGKTEVHFAHLGLVPEYECYDICANAWAAYINSSLQKLITTGKGHPNSKEKANTADEVRLSHE